MSFGLDFGPLGAEEQARLRVARSAAPIRSERGTSPLITYVVRPRRVSAQGSLAGIARQLVDAPTPEQSKPPTAGTPKSTSGAGSCRPNIGVARHSGRRSSGSGSARSSRWAWSARRRPAGPARPSGVDRQCLRERPGSLRPGGGLGRRQLEVVLRRRVIEPQSEHAGHGLRAGVGRRVEAHVAELRLDLAGRGAERQVADEGGVVSCLIVTARVGEAAR